VSKIGSLKTGRTTGRPGGEKKSAKGEAKKGNKGKNQHAQKLAIQNTGGERGDEMGNMDEMERIQN